MTQQLRYHEFRIPRRDSEYTQKKTRCVLEIYSEVNFFMNKGIKMI